MQAESLDPGVEEVGVDRAQVCLVEAQLLPRARSGVLEDDVGGAHELEEAAPILIASEIECHPSLRAVAVHVDVRRGRRQEVRALAAGGLDLDDVGAQLREEPCGKRPRPEARQIDDAVTGEGATLPAAP